MCLAEDIERDPYYDDLMSFYEEVSVFKNHFFKNFIWTNKYGNKVDVRTVSDNYFKNICNMLVNNYYFTVSEIELLKEKRNIYRKNNGIESKKYKLIVKGEVVFEYDFYPQTNNQIAIGLLYSNDGKLDKMNADEIRRIILKKDYKIMQEII